MVTELSSQNAGAGDRLFNDMLGNSITIHGIPKRIISLVPSQTELLYDLGLDEEVVGITKFCVHPEAWFRSKTRVGGTKTVHMDRIQALQPDLVIANKEENTTDQIEAISALYPTWVSNIQNMDDALRMIGEVGTLVGREQQAQSLVHEIKKGFSALKSRKTRRVAYFIWRDPWMCAGGDTFINNVIEMAGWENVLKHQDRYPEIQLDSIVPKNVDLVLLSSEPYPFKEKHIMEIKAVLPDADVLLVDGEMFSWYGSRLKYAAAYISELIRRLN
jgi:ABC-type Fe3+-hydroxamate transport system substrate-binding protein